MVDNTNPVIDEQDKRLKQAQEDMKKKTAENLSRTETKKEERPESPETPQPDKPEEDKAPAQNIPVVNDGISRAYADDMPPQKTAEKKKSKSHNPKPPERGKPPKVAGGKDIMEVAWNEFWAFCDSVIDGTVDLVFDFIVFALYPTSSDNNDEVKKETDVMDIGAKHHQKNIEKVNKTHKFASDVCIEIDKNLQNVIAGEDAEWTLTKKEPAFFTRLVDIKKKAISDPASPEAEMIKRWENMPQVLEQVSENYKKLITLADHLAIVEEYLEPATKNKDAEIKEAKEKYKTDPEKLKETLDAIEESYKKPEKKIEESIASRSQKHLEVLSQNVNKIRALHKDNPEQLREVLGKYVEGISNALKKVHQDVYVNMYEKNEHGKKAREQAQASITAMFGAINDFQVEGKFIKEHKPAEKHEIIKMDMDEKYSKSDIFRLIRNHVMTK